MARACQNDIGRLNIRNKESPEGDGNFYSYFSVEHIKLEIKKAPKGTETLSKNTITKTTFLLEIKKAPKGTETITSLFIKNCADLLEIKKAPKGTETCAY